jgi:DNA repair protein RadA/Sms
MSKSKTEYVCESCGWTTPKWAGKCGGCNAFNTLVEQRVQPAKASASGNRHSAWAGSATAARNLKDVKAGEVPRLPTGLDEFDRVLGGGLVRGSVVLLGGDPGIGKSTLLLQTLASVGANQSTLYCTGEESPEQIALRAHRLGLEAANVRLAAQIDLLEILATLESEKPAVAVIDSIQTVYHPELQSAPGSVAQIRECAAHLTRFAKTSGCCLLLVGHVTKEGDIAGPRVLEHIVDAALFFEGENGTSFRMLRALKNRFGAVNEMGVFAMGERGLEEVSNPSSLFLTQHDKPVSGTCVLAAMEGNRPFLVEIQALVEDSPSPNPRRYASGFELARLQMLLAVLNKHGGVDAFDQNVYLKIVGGVRITEPAADLPALLAACSSLSKKPLPEGWVAFGEVGLAGELRPVQGALSRLKEAAKLGFKVAIVPRGNEPEKEIRGLKVFSAARVEHALAEIWRQR